MRRFWLLGCLLLTAFIPIYEKHDSPEKVDSEFKEVEGTTQPKQWRVFSNTPTLTDLEDHESILVSSNGWVSIMWRDNVEIYAIQLSCTTVIR